MAHVGQEKLLGGDTFLWPVASFSESLAQKNKRNTMNSAEN
jgi:hypothetical protein